MRVCVCLRNDSIYYLNVCMYIHLLVCPNCTVRPTLQALLKKMTHKQKQFIRTYVQKAVADRVRL